MNGVLVIDKPQGWTSHDVVAHIKRKLGAKKTGHLGTLDPLATGLLLIVLDKATRFAVHLEGGVKEYFATMKLGEETQSYDSESEIVKTGDISNITEQDVKNTLAGFMGRISQVPPMYSSVKKDGTPLYKLARKGIVIERQAREVDIHGIELVRFYPPFVDFRVECSRGTYVRAICHDAGAMLGCGAHMTGLRRTRSGPFTIEEACLPGEAREVLEARVIPLEAALRRAGAGEEALKKALLAGC